MHILIISTHPDDVLVVILEVVVSLEAASVVDVDGKRLPSELSEGERCTIVAVDTELVGSGPPVLMSVLLHAIARLANRAATSWCRIAGRIDTWWNPG